MNTISDTHKKNEPSEKRIVVTTSWDDGHALDMKLADLLKRYGIKGTFYVAPRDIEFNQESLLTDVQIIKLSRDFEIGAHTMTHRQLPMISLHDAKNEMVESKLYLEKLIGRKISSFCYPRGEYTAAHVLQAKEVGFTLARTVSRFEFDVGKNLFELPTTIHAYDHWSDAWAVLKFSHFNLFKFFAYYVHWDELAVAMFEKVKKEGGVYHLWGHSWEVEGHNDWRRLERVLSHISNQPEVKYFTNSETI